MNRYDSDLRAELVQHIGSDEMIVKAARVSTATDLVEGGEVGGLINFLVKNRHGSPFEHGSMTFRIEAPIFVAREFMRHRAGWSYNEESGRYTEMQTRFYVPAKDRPLVQTGKPGHYEFIAGDEPEVLHAKTSSALRQAYAVASGIYHLLLMLGVAKEVARMVLPVGVYTTFYATCNPRSLMHFLSLRTKDPESTFPSYPMHEIEQVARGMEAAFAELYPETYEAWVRNGRVAP